MIAAPVKCLSKCLNAVGECNLQLIGLCQEVQMLQHVCNTRRYHSRTSSVYSSLNSSRLQITFTDLGNMNKKPPVGDLGFGKYFTDHMLQIKWTATNGWEDPQIGPLRPFQMHPAAKVLHYAQEAFEGMKAYRGVDNKIRLFRPMLNIERLASSAQRACLPHFDGEHLLQCIRRLIQIEQEWVPFAESSSLYIRPTMIGIEPTLGVAASNEVMLFVLLSPAGSFFASGLKPVNLLADPNFVRAWPGGCGSVKMGSNYASTLWSQEMAKSKGCHQCLWLFGEDDELTEVGAMNIFAVIKKQNSLDIELITPSLESGVILPGITRRSVIELAKEWDEIEVNERKLTMGEILRAKEEGRLVEMFATGTAAIVNPIGNILYKDQMQSIPTSIDRLGRQRIGAISQRIRTALSNIYYGRIEHPWAVGIESLDEHATPDHEKENECQEPINRTYQPHRSIQYL